MCLMRIDDDDDDVTNEYVYIDTDATWKTKGVKEENIDEEERKASILF